jgi:hypothetical protein
VERDHAAQIVAAHRFGHANLASQRASIFDLDPVSGNKPAFLCPVAVGCVIDADNHHLIVSEKLARDCFGEAQPVELFTEECSVVHGGELEIGLLGFFHDAASEVAGGGGHE